jgi:hypothetical protein
MKRFFLVVACVAGLALTGSTASAQAPVQGVVTGNCNTPGGCGSNSTGTVFSRLMFWKGSSCSTCGNGAGTGFKSWTNNAAGQPRAGYGAAPHNPYPQGTPGTLVFPQHPFVRSPRDYFMTDAK